jgi:hypothetical protein
MLAAMLFLVFSGSPNLCTYMLVSPPMLRSLVDEDPDGSGVALYEGDELLTLFVGVLVGDMETCLPTSIANNIKVLRLFVDKMPTPCSGMEMLRFLTDGVCRFFGSTVQHANARDTGDSPSGTLSELVLRSWRCCWCFAFWHETVNSSSRACGGCRMYPTPPS